MFRLTVDFSKEELEFGPNQTHLVHPLVISDLEFKSLPPHCIVDLNTLLNLPPEWFSVINIHFYFPISRQLLVVFCFMFMKDRSLSLAQISRPMLLTALDQSPTRFPPMNLGNPLLWAGITPYRICLHPSQRPPLDRMNSPMVSGRNGDRTTPPSTQH